MRAVFLLFTTTLLSACAVPIKDSVTLSHGVSYLGKTGLSGETFAPIVRPGPGMKLAVIAMPKFGRQQNSITPVPAAFEWTLPKAGRYGRQDFLAVSSLLSVAETRGDGARPRDPMFCIRKLGNELRAQADDDTFFQRFAGLVVAPVVDSLAVRYQGKAAHAEGTPAWYRALANEGRAIDFDAFDSATPVYIEFETVIPDQPGTTCDRMGREKVGVFARGADAFHTRDPAEYAGISGYPNVWLGRTASGAGPQAASIVLAVEVPLQLKALPGHHFVPFYFSVADVEEHLGLDVRGLSRRAAYFPNPALVPAVDKVAIETARPKSDQRFEIWFDAAGFEAAPTAPLIVPAHDKSRVLIAAGDILYWRNASR